MRRGGLRFSLYLLYFPSYDVINDVIMSDADCTHGCEPRSVAASLTLSGVCCSQPSVLCQTYTQGDGDGVCKLAECR